MVLALSRVRRAVVRLWLSLFCYAVFCYAVFCASLLSAAQAVRLDDLLAESGTPKVPSRLSGSGFRVLSSNHPSSGGHASERDDTNYGHNTHGDSRDGDSRDSNSNDGPPNNKGHDGGSSNQGEGDNSGFSPKSGGGSLNDGKGSATSTSTSLSPTFVPSSPPGSIAGSSQGSTSTLSLSPCPPPSFFFCFDNNDGRLQYSGSWSLKTLPNGRTLRASNTTGSSVSLNFTGLGVSVFGITGEHGVRAVGSYEINGGTPDVPLVPDSSMPALVPLFSRFLYNDSQQSGSQQDQLSPSPYSLVISVGNASDLELPSNFVLSHVMAIPYPPHMNSTAQQDSKGGHFRPSSPDLNSTAIVGGVLGGIIIILASALLFLVCKRRRAQHSSRTWWRRRFPANAFTRTDFTSLTPTSVILAHRGVTETEPSEKAGNTQRRERSWVTQPIPLERLGSRTRPTSVATLQPYTFAPLSRPASVSLQTLRQVDLLQSRVVIGDAAQV